MASNRWTPFRCGTRTAARCRLGQAGLVDAGECQLTLEDPPLFLTALTGSVLFFNSFNSFNPFSPTAPI